VVVVVVDVVVDDVDVVVVDEVVTRVDVVVSPTPDASLAPHDVNENGTSAHSTARIHARDVDRERLIRTSTRY
jgi:hypothetical protein